MVLILFLARLDTLGSAQSTLKLDHSKLSSFKSFVESKILSKSDKTLDDADKAKYGLFPGITPSGLGVSN